MKKPTKAQMQLIKKLPFKYQIIALIVFLVVANFSYFTSFTKEYSLEKVSDGDTIVLLSKGEKIKVRFYGIDAPESAQEYGQFCKNMLSDFLKNKDIKLEIKDKDKYGRVVGIVYANGEDINKAMVRNGCAWSYQNYTKKYVDDEKYARANKLGLWQGKNPQNPREFRLEHKRD
ncbi:MULTISPECIES: thermonuclease family protein [unclassified Campylobacter]|uniref:thermonuclease family protein n=1 Tax=unclassified Campylobacter TaxID=2593542 RepID=UPI003014B583